MARAPKEFELQDPHSLAGKREGNLEVAIGREVREFRRKLDMTVAELARLAGMSAGMLSKIENGMTSPSLDTLKSLSTALHVPVTAFFRRYEEERDATYVKAGQGLNIERRGTRAGHQYQLLGHSLRRPLAVEPYLITLTADSDVFPLFQHEGIEFIYMLEGEVGYRHGNRTYVLTPGDSLFFDADVPHGPDEAAQAADPVSLDHHLSAGGRGVTSLFPPCPGLSWTKPAVTVKGSAYKYHIINGITIYPLVRFRIRSFPTGKFLSFHLNADTPSTKLPGLGNAGGKESSPCAESSGCS